MSTLLLVVLTIMFYYHYKYCYISNIITTIIIINLLLFIINDYLLLFLTGFSRLIFQDFLNDPQNDLFTSLIPWEAMNIEESYESRDVDTACRAIGNQK